jgi:hypothetical protein
MEKPVPQSFKKHARFVPAFHFFVAPVLLVNAIYQLVLLKDGISFRSIMAALVGISLFVLAGLARSAALAVQDRVICLEVQTRMEKLFPAELRPRIVEYTPEQLIGLRFASDAELPFLAQQVLDEKIADRKTIKSRVKNWRPDYMRA